MPSDAQKIFISYTQADREWAEWIAWQLDEAGHEPTLQAWHFGPGSDFVHKMHTAIRESDRTIAVLSPAYEGSAFSFAEWAGAFAEDPTGEDRKLVPVRVEPYEPTGLLRTKVYVDLVDLTEDDARQRLLDVLRGPGKPARAPGFPAANRKMTPSFPGGARVPKYGLPHATDAVFLGRDQDIERLHEAMQPTDAVVLTARISAHGGGGIGKTRLAFEYACRYASEYPGGVFWAVVGDREPIAVWTELARRLFLGVRDLETDNEAALAFLDAIERSDKPQLLVLDDLTGDHQRFSQRLEISGVTLVQNRF